MIDCSDKGPMMKTDGDMLFRRQGETGIVEINRPAKKNALSSNCWQQLRQILTQAVQSVRVLVITGAGTDMFCAGVDISLDDPFMTDMMTALEKGDGPAIESKFKPIHDTLFMLENLPIPTIAALNGNCYSGGLELALACDIRAARSGITMAFQETRLGLMPDLGGTVRLARLLGPARAKDLIFSCRKFGPDEALAMGLVQHVFREENFMDAVTEYATLLADNSPRALEGVKNVINRSAVMEAENAFHLERQEASRTILSRQCVEGIGAFFEKRPPDWKQ